MRLRNQLLVDHPDVLDRLLEVGATVVDSISVLPEGLDRTPMDGDDELVALVCRRTTFEWALHRLVLDEGAASSCAACCATACYRLRERTPWCCGRP